MLSDHDMRGIESPRLPSMSEFGFWPEAGAYYDDQNCTCPYEEDAPAFDAASASVPHMDTITLVSLASFLVLGLAVVANL